jgi:hypothetical protein
MEVANALGGNMKRRGKHLTAIQLRALSEFRKMKPYDPESDKPEKDAIIQTWFRLLEKPFFFATLRDYCTVEILEDERTTTNGVCFANHRLTGSDEYGPEEVLCSIKIFNLRRTIRDRKKRLNQYLKTLVHEMAHAVLEIYCCGCQKQCSMKKWCLTGRTGHGRAWHDIISNLHPACMDLLKKDFNDDNEESQLAMEVKARMCGEDLSFSNHQIQNWTSKVNELLGITKYEVEAMWKYSLHKVAEYVAQVTDSDED